MIVNHPLQHCPVQRFAAYCGLAVDADCFPACRTLTEDVDGVGLRVDDLADPVAGFPEHVLSDGHDEDAALDAVAVGLQARGDAGPAPVIADVIGDHVSQRHASPVQEASGSWTQVASRSACR